MCGIAGAVNRQLPVAATHALLRHRGPDDQTDWSDGSVQLIHTRLAIQELSAAGRQPMHHGSLHLIFNGEIFNHYELRTRYKLACKSHSDTETLLHLFQQLGIEMLHELDGMFAFALYDSDQRKIWLARDRAGEKPLYYAGENGSWVFASTLPVIQQVVRANLNYENLALFLAVGYMDGARTPFEGIHELEAGHYLELDSDAGSPRLVQWWNRAPFFEQPSALSFEDALAETDRLLRQSIARRMVSSDVEVGCFLSGGIDSGLVTALARLSATRLRTFTVSFSGSFNEAPLAAAVARHLDTQHTEIEISFQDLAHDLATIFGHYGEPIMDDSIIPSYYVSREAKRHVTVVLNGDGGDELFAGYRRYVPFRKMNLFADRGSRFFGLLERSLPAPSDKMGLYNYAHRLLAMLSQPGAAAYFAATVDLLHRHEHHFVNRPPLAALEKTIEAVLVKPITSLQKMLQLDGQLLLPAILLVKMDVASMAHALETRSPFLSRELLAWAPSLRDEWQIHGTTTKFLLRNLAKRYLPDEIISQPKRGFEVPLRAWMDGELRERVFDLLSHEHAFVTEFLPHEFVQAMLAGKVRAITPEQRAKILFSWLSLECWHQQQKTWL
jgi:asparagine synthase (glutamine-hydrolysing)